MNATTELLRGELERSFELDELKALSSNLLGFPPEDVGGTSAKGSFARALVDRCVREDSLVALADAMVFSKSSVKPIDVDANAEELPAATVIDGWKLQKKLGEGGIGVTYLAEKDGQRAALKVMRFSHARDRGAARRWLTAVRAAGSIETPNLASVLASGSLADGRPWVATRYVDGQHLGSRIARTGPMHFNEARPILRGVLLGLEALHKRGFTHGNVKVENVFVQRAAADAKVTNEPTGVLVDPGADRLLARAPAGSPTTSGVVPLAGTAKSLAPEQARTGKPAASADVYAAGVLLYETVTGKAPFTGDTAIDVVVRQLTTDAEAPSSVAPRGWVNKDLDQIVLRALAKNPSERYASAQAFREAIESIGRATIPPEAKKADDLDQSAFDKAKAAVLADPKNEELAQALERIVDPAQAWEKAAEIFREAATKAEAVDAKKSLLFRAARLYENDVKDANQAEASYRAILNIDENDDIALAALEELKRQTGDSEGLVELLLEKAERETDPSDRAAVLREIAETYEERLTDADNAFVAYVQALAEDPRDTRVAQAIDRLATGNNARWAEAVESTNQAAQETQDPARKTALYVILGRWYADKVGRPDFALPCYSQALALDPANDAAIDGTVDLYRKAQSYPELAQALVKRAELATNPVKARDHRAEAAELYLRRLNDSARATALFQEILKEDPAHTRATEALETLFAEKKDWQGLLELLETKAAHQTGDDKIETLSAIAEVYEDRMSDLDGAQQRYEAALGLSPKYVPALKGLERIYAQKGNHEALHTNLRTQLETVATPRQRIQILERIGSIQEEEFVDTKKAAQAYEDIVAIEPGHDGANAGLARVYRKLSRFDELAKTLERHALSSADEARKIQLLLTAARTLMIDVGAPERAGQMAERVLSVAPDSAEALELVARLRAKSGDTRAATEAVKKLADNEKDPAKKAELLVRAGRILEDGGDKDGAIHQYKAALEVRKDDGEALSALRSVYESRGDAKGAGELLQREIDGATTSEVKAKLFGELGQLKRERQKDAAGAKAAFEQALKLDAGAVLASKGLGDLAFDAGDLALAVRYYEPLLSRTSELSKEDALALCLRTGDALRKEKQIDRAQRAYLNAKVIAPDDVEVMERVAEATFESGAPDEAAELYRDFLAKAGKNLQGVERGRVLYRLGDALRRSGELDEAKTYLEEAMQLTPSSKDPIRALKELYLQKGEWETVVSLSKKELEKATEDERFDLLVEQGDVLFQKLKDKSRAQKAYVAALEVRADDRNLLSKLMAVYSETKDWSKLVEIILRIAELVTDRVQLAKYYQTAASISHRELGRVDEAADYYEQALDLAPQVGKPFEGLVEALNTKADFARLEKAYRERIKRLEALGDAIPAKDLAHLYDSLGELLKHRLSRPVEAVEAFEKAQRLDPENRRRAEQLADIFAKEPKKYFQQAVRVHQQLLQISPYRIESYQALRKLYTEAKKPDESFCVCQALTVLKNAEPDEEQFFRKHRSRKAAEPKEKLTDELFTKLIQHGDLDPMLADIFQTITPAVLAVRSQSLQSLKLGEGNKKPATDPTEIVKALAGAAKALAMPVPDLYFRDEDQGGLSFLYTNPPAIGIGKSVRASAPAQVFSFLAGRHLAYLRGGAFLRFIVPSASGLRAWLLSAIQSVVPQFPVPNELAGQVAEDRQAIRTHLAGPAQEILRSQVHRLLTAAPELDLRRYTAALDYTADRIGFIVANDLEVATAVVKASGEDAASVSQKDRLRELHLYSVSEAYLTLRHKLGLAIGE